MSWTVCAVSLLGILQGLAGVVYGLARGFDPGGTVFDMQMNVLKLQCAGECIEIAGDAFDVGGAESRWRHFWKPPEMAVFLLFPTVFRLS